MLKAIPAHLCIGLRDADVKPVRNTGHFVNWTRHPAL